MRGSGRPESVTATATTISWRAARPKRAASMASKRLRTKAASLWPSGTSIAVPSVPRFFARRHQRGALLDRHAQRRAELGVEDRRGVLEFARLAHDRRFAVALRVRRARCQRATALGCRATRRVPRRCDQRVERFARSGRVGVVDRRDGDRAARRRLDRAAHFHACFVHLHDQLAKFEIICSVPVSGTAFPSHPCRGQRQRPGQAGSGGIPKGSLPIGSHLCVHRSPSHLEMFSARKAADTRVHAVPVLIARMYTSSSAAGAPGTRTSIASKCPRT